MRESFTLVCLKIIKHGDPAGDQRNMGLFYNIYSNKLYTQAMSFSFEVKRLTKENTSS